MTEYDVQSVIIRQWDGSNNLMMPNINGRYGEMDVLRLTRSGYATEFEVKITRSDFFSDRKKREKHRVYSDVFNNVPRTGWNNEPASTKGVPNYFVYVVPVEIGLAGTDVPFYAGLYVITDGHLENIKPAPPLHREKYREYWIEKIAHSACAKYLHCWFYKTR